MYFLALPKYKGNCYIMKTEFTVRVLKSQPKTRWEGFKTLISLSIPPVNSSLPASARHMAVIGKSVEMKVTASFVRVSHI